MRQILSSRPARWGAIMLSAVTLGACASQDWPMFRRDARRSANQPHRSALSDPARVTTLHVGWSFQPPGPRAFRASPVVRWGRVFIGNGNGYFYSLDAATGAVLWQYPPAADPGLTTTFTCNPSSGGIASSAATAHIGGRHAVIFGAPDPSVGSGRGEGRLFALDAETGAVIWKSPIVASLPPNPTQTHEQIGYSAPLVLKDRVYVGVANHCDNPIQRGKVVAVRLDTGALDLGFSFFGSGPPRGGGVWSSPAGSGRAVYVTTGNTNIGGPEPPDNHGLSLLRLDRKSGAIRWKHQPVPYDLDGDPDWASGAALMQTSCGKLVASTMKDGWTHAVNSGDGTPGPPNLRWAFPQARMPFAVGDGTVHGDTRYLRPGAAWGDVFVTMTGGENVTTSVTSGYGRLHALEACAPSAGRVRWILDVPGTAGSPIPSYRLGPPTMTRGMVYIGTGAGQLVVIADPSIWPAAGSRCENPDVPTATCVASGFKLVPEPTVLRQVPFVGAIMTEPALAHGRVYVATGFFTSDPGTLYMLEP